MKRIMTVLLVLLCVSAPANAPQWSYDESNMVLRLEGMLSGDVTIPSEMDGLTRVTLNDGLAYIGDNFKACHALTSLTIPVSVRMVDSAFGSCEKSEGNPLRGRMPPVPRHGLVLLRADGKDFLALHKCSNRRIDMQSCFL